MTPDQLKLLKELTKLGNVLYLPKPKKDLIVDAIASMNIAALKILLDDDKTYVDTTKEIFLNKLELLFEDFKLSGDTALKIENGTCGSSQCSNCGEKVYRFVGNQSKNYFDFIFEMNGKTIVEISYCFLFKTNIKSDNLGEPVYIEIDRDDRIDFNKSPEYLELYNATQVAYCEIISNPPILLNIESMDLFIQKYSNLYHCIICNGDYNDFQMKWDNFLNIFTSILNIKKYLTSSDYTEILLANNFLEQTSHEQDLIDWVLKYENNFHLTPYEIKWCFERQNEFLICKLSSEIHFYGEQFNHVYDFVTSYRKHEKDLLEKYNTYTEEEYNEAQNIEAHLNKGSDLFSLQFHINKRKELTALGISLPFYLGKV